MLTMSLYRNHKKNLPLFETYSKQLYRICVIFRKLNILLTVIPVKYVYALIVNN